jgi:hypothetical protein
VRAWKSGVLRRPHVEQVSGQHEVPVAQVFEDFMAPTGFASTSSPTAWSILTAYMQQRWVPDAWPG